MIPAARLKNRKSERCRCPRWRELNELREEKPPRRKSERPTNRQLRQEPEGLQRRLGRQEMHENLLNVELEKARLLAKLQSWARPDQTLDLNIRTRETVPCSLLGRSRESLP